LWIWESEGEKFFFDNYEVVRVQIREEEWNDLGSRAAQQNPDEPLASPYKLGGSMAEDGLGCCIWWEE
jgi:DNA-directed RNA polymerase III subunit RPC8